MVITGFGKTLYNIRKLQELPHHLAHSDAWSDFHAHVACNVEFLVAVSCTLGVTSLLGQFQAMMSRGTDDVEDEESKQKVKDILLIRSIIRLGIDDIRREPSSVPVQVRKCIVFESLSVIFLLILLGILIVVEVLVQVPSFLLSGCWCF